MIYLPTALYHYVRLNEDAFTQNTTEQHLKQIQYNVNDVVSFLNKRYEKEDIEKYIQFLNSIPNFLFNFEMILDHIKDGWSGTLRQMLILT